MLRRWRSEELPPGNGQNSHQQLWHQVWVSWEAGLHREVTTPQWAVMSNKNKNLSSSTFQISPFLMLGNSNPEPFSKRESASAIPSVKWQKQCNLVMSLMSFIQGKTIHALGEYSVSWAMEHSSQGILGKIKLYRALGEGRWKLGMTGQVRDFLTRVAGPTV